MAKVSTTNTVDSSVVLAQCVLSADLPHIRGTAKVEVLAREHKRNHQHSAVHNQKERTKRRVAKHDSLQK